MTKLQLFSNAAVVAFAMTMGDLAWYVISGFKWNPIVSISAIVAIFLLTIALLEYAV
jgi:hypothetical protein